jgi:hypothetical protein
MVAHHFMNRITCGLGILFAASLKAKDRPNFVLMIADDISYKHIAPTALAE